MEADWSVALADDDPKIIVPWAALAEEAPRCKFLDLRRDPTLIDEIEEARSYPVLRTALLRLNAARSSLWTAKCGTWSSSVDDGAEPYDPYEMNVDPNADPGDILFGAGSYIDLLPRDGQLSMSFERQERWIRSMTGKLRGVAARASRTEFVLRRAEIDGTPGFGVTWFVEGCGATALRAAEAWEAAFSCALGVILEAGLMEAGPPVDGTISKVGE
jgi:hypothetical protein